MVLNSVSAPLVEALTLEVLCHLPKVRNFVLAQLGAVSVSGWV
jgi:hypothetical protein